MRPQYLRWWAWPPPSTRRSRARRGCRAPSGSRWSPGCSRRWSPRCSPVPPRRSSWPTPGRWCAGACRWCGQSAPWRRAATVGLLGLAAFLAPERTRTNRRVTATRYAASAATVWAVAALLEVVLTFADLAGTPLTSAGPVRPAGLVHLDPGDDPGAAHQRARRGRRRGVGAAHHPPGPDGVARGVHPGRGRHPRPHRSRRRLGQPRGCRQRPRRAPARRRRVDRRADRACVVMRRAARRRPRRDRGALLDRRGLVLRGGGPDRRAAGLDPAGVGRGADHRLRRGRRAQDAGHRGARGARLAAPAQHRDGAHRAAGRRAAPSPGWRSSRSRSWGRRPGWPRCWRAACRRCPTPRRRPAASSS